MFSVEKWEEVFISAEADITSGGSSGFARVPDTALFAFANGYDFVHNRRWKLMVVILTY